ncbi:MAG: aminoacyl-tRNA hydrolase [Chloroflexi bacterium]|nr:aminoacyl-tRNA hydrolase [Chloroflexota bacterium]
MTETTSSLFWGKAAHQPRYPDWLIVGLGNPGRAYSQTRHNAGAMAVGLLARRHHIAIDRRRGKAKVGEGAIGGAGVLLALPQTFMNASGEVVGPLVRWAGVPLQRLLVLYDDLDLPLGTIRLRPSGSAGGHNGMRSIMAALGGDEGFPRLRIGIGRPEEAGQDAISYVLAPFSSDQRPALAEALERAAAALEVLLAEGLERAMGRFN